LGNRNQPFRRLLPACDREIVSTRDTTLMRSDQLPDSRIGKLDSEEIQQSSASDEEGNFGIFKPLPEGSVNCNTGNHLPNARLVSRTIHTDAFMTTYITHLFPIFGQFVAHDFIQTGTQNADISCCSRPAMNVYANCLPIMVPPGDTNFASGHCLDFKRATVYCNGTDHRRRHVNLLSAFIDAENLYGVDPATSHAIRAYTGGRLTEGPSSLLPRMSLKGGPVKYTAGESRATQNPALTTIHTIFLREHNRIADQIAEANSLLNDEQVQLFSPN